MSSGGTLAGDSDAVRSRKIVGCLTVSCAIDDGLDDKEALVQDVATAVPDGLR